MRMPAHPSAPKNAKPAALRLAAAAALAHVALGCVDPDGRYDAFLERTRDLRGRDAGAVATGERFDFSGQYLAALSTTLAPDQPILLRVDVSVAEDLGELELTLQALATDAQEMPRAPVGESIDASAVPYEEDGSFSVDLGELSVPGEANPISGSEIVATVAITATAFPASDELPDHFCGEVTGLVSVPLALDLAGSTLGAVQTDDLLDAEPLLRCPE